MILATSSASPRQDDGSRVLCVLFAVRALMSLSLCVAVFSISYGQPLSSAAEVRHAVEMLRHRNPDVRAAALTLMGDTAEQLREGLHALGVLSDVLPGQGRNQIPEELSARRRQEVLDELDKAGPAIAALVDDDEPRVRRLASLVLGQVRVEGRISSAAWLRLSKRPDVEDQLAVARGLQVYVNRGGQLRRDYRALVAAGASHLDRITGDTIAIMPVMAATLRSEYAEVVEEGLKAVAGLLVAFSEVQTLDPTNAASVRFRQRLPATMEAMSQIGLDLQRLLQSDVPSVQIGAALAVEELERLCDGREDPRTGQPRGRFLRSDLAPEGQQAARSLRQGIANAEPVLGKVLLSSDDPVQLSVLNTLEIHGPQSREVQEAVVTALGDRNVFVRWAAARVLGRVASDAVTPSMVHGLARLVGDPDIDVQLVACHVLEDMAAHALEAIPALVEASASEERTLQLAAVSALRAITAQHGERAKAAVPGFLAALDSTDFRVRRLAPEGLAQIGPAAREAVPALRRALSDSSIEVRQAAAQAMLRILGH